MNRLLLLAALAAAGLPAAAPTAGEIMERVSKNQQQYVEARKHWVYHQSELIRVLHRNGKIDSEEEREYVIAPTPDGITRKMVRGLKRNGKVVVSLDGPPDSVPATRDGIPDHPFPFEGGRQALYHWTLQGEEMYRDRHVWKLTFRPKQQGWRGEAIWAGELLVDAEEYQPVLMTTGLAPKIPMAVRVLLGTNVEQVGFKLTWRKLEDGVWFPDSWGGEFKLRALFFINRRIAVSMRNSEFRKTDVQSAVSYETAQAP